MVRVSVEIDVRGIWACCFGVFGDGSEREDWITVPFLAEQARNWRKSVNKSKGRMRVLIIRDGIFIGI
jgi:hypothetical protein